MCSIGVASPGQPSVSSSIRLPCDTAIARGSFSLASGSRASTSATDSARVALRRASQPASASPTGPAPTIAMSKSKAGVEAAVVIVRES